MTTLPELHNVAPKILHLLFIVVAVTAVAIADVCLKKAAADGSWALTLKSPWMILAVLLYFIQIIFFTYLFRSGKELSVIGNMQTILYALVVLGAGIFLFQESLNKVQLIGVLLALTGVILINLK
jgi:drug/metabolite transporter (DMT)-like permease